MRLIFLHCCLREARHKRVKKRRCCNPLYILEFMARDKPDLHTNTDFDAAQSDDECFCLHKLHSLYKLQSTKEKKMSGWLTRIATQIFHHHRYGKRQARVLLNNAIDPSTTPRTNSCSLRQPPHGGATHHQRLQRQSAQSLLHHPPPPGLPKRPCGGCAVSLGGRCRPRCAG